MPRNAEATRATIRQAAHLLFYRHGFARVQMTDIARKAGISKRTLYNHFPSKDTMLEAMLDHQRELSIEVFKTSFAEVEGGPEVVVRRIFDDLLKWIQTDRWIGSGITRLAIELGDMPGHPALRMARRHKALIEGLLAERLKKHGARDGAALARTVWPLIEGAMTMFLIHRDRSYVDSAARAADVLVSAHQAATC